MRFLPGQSKQVDCAPFMNGLRAVTLVLGIMLLASNDARAQSCMCADTGLPLSEADAALLQEALGAQSDGDLLESEGELAAAKRVLAPQDSEDLPWCTNQNDPQCSERPAGAVPSLVSVDASPSVALGAQLALPSVYRIPCDFVARSSGGPRDAVRLKLERPPQ
jgi:hypothetical protein